MAVILKGIVCGDKKVGKTSFLEQISTGKKTSRNYEVDLIDPTTQSTIKFLLDETNEITNSICVFLVYSMTSQYSFNSIQEKWFPLVQSKLNFGSSFVIILGTHSDSNEKSVDSHEAEEFAAGNGAFHMEISTINKRNIELTLKLMRIRAFYLLRKHPEIKNSDNFSSPKSPSNSSFSSFSLNIPLPFKDFSALQSKRNRYDEHEKKTFAESVFDSSEEKQKKSLVCNEEKNMSFADMGDFDEIPNLSDEFIEEKFDEISIDTLGSPSWHQKVPPLSIINMPSYIFPQTERSNNPSTSFLESGSSTERANKDPLLILEILLEKSVKKIEVFADDNAESIAERVLGEFSEKIEVLSEMIEKAVNDYIGQVRTISLKKPLYKVKIAVGNN